MRPEWPTLRMASLLRVAGEAIGAGDARFEGVAWSGAVAWLAVGSLTTRGARRRGQRCCFAWRSGLFFPVSWVIGYVVHERGAGGRATRRRRREAL